MTDEPGSNRKAVFVDRDGTLNELVYNETHGILDSPRKPGQVMMIQDAGRFLKGIRDMGFFVSVVTNQPGIAKGTLTENNLEAVNTRLAELLAEEGGTWDDLRYSPHHPDGGPWARPEYVGPSDTRKPEPGMLRQAAQEYDIDLLSSWMIGDGLVDVQAGRAAGCRTILITRLKISQVEQFFSLENSMPDAIAGNLMEALDIIRSGTVS